MTELLNYDDVLSCALQGRDLWLEKCLDTYSLVVLDCGIPEFERLCGRAEEKARANPNEWIAIVSPRLPALNSCVGIEASDDEIDKILGLYSLYDFTPRLAVASLDRPAGRKLGNLLDSGVAALDELIDTILGM
ncbi:MAG: hypothetical protein LBT59_01005 [Clostridiales bacterium]|nr:hypothetical protein [Clostridiales bacterium]